MLPLIYQINTVDIQLTELLFASGFLKSFKVLSQPKIITCIKAHTQTYEQTDRGTYHRTRYISVWDRRGTAARCSRECK